MVFSPRNWCQGHTCKIHHCGAAWENRAFSEKAALWAGAMVPSAHQAPSTLLSARASGTWLLFPAVHGTLVHSSGLAAFPCLPVYPAATVPPSRASGSLLLQQRAWPGRHLYAIGFPSTLEGRAPPSLDAWFSTCQTNKATGTLCNQGFSICLFQIDLFIHIYLVLK